MVGPRVTFREGAPITHEELIARVRKTQVRDPQTCQTFHELFYGCDHTWTVTHFLGWNVMKNPLDLWMYQQLISEIRPAMILETGSAAGGSALWFAMVLDMLTAPPEVKVHSVDLDEEDRPTHPRIVWHRGDSADPVIVQRIAQDLLPGRPILVSLDSEHSEEHVYAELCAYAPLVPIGSYLVVEDTNASWYFEPGPRGALIRYLEEHPDEFLSDVSCERYLITSAPGSWLIRVDDAQ